MQGPRCDMKRLIFLGAIAVSGFGLVMCGDDDGSSPPGGGGSPDGSMVRGDGGVLSEGGGDILDGSAGDGATVTRPKFSFVTTLPGYFVRQADEQPAIAGIPGGGGYVAALPLPGNATLGSDAITSNGSTVALVKFDTKGAIQWAKAIQPSGDALLPATPMGLAVDETGSIYLAGRTYSASVDFGNGKTLTSPVAASKSWGYIAKFDAAGTAQWAQPISADGGFLHLHIAARGSTVVVGGTASYGKVAYRTSGGTVVSPAFMGFETKAFVVSLSPSDGYALWFEQVSASSGASSLDLGILASNEVVLAGGFDGDTLQNDDLVTLTSTPSTSGRHAFISKFTSAGVHAWTRNFVGAGASALAIAPTNRLVVAGGMGGPWVVSLDPANGNTDWDTALPTGSPVDLAVDGRGNIALSLDPFGPTATASVDGVAFPTTKVSFLTGLEPSGKVAFVQVATNDAGAHGGELASSGSGMVEYGLFRGTADFGNGRVTSAGDGAGVTGYLFGFEF
jgi:hypothetical protein